MNSPQICKHAITVGARVPCAANLPLDMNDPQSVWFVEHGAIDVFLVERQDGADQTAPQHLLRAEAGRLLPGVAAQQEDTTLGLIGKGLPGTVLRRLPVSELAALDADALAQQVDAWVMDVSATLSRDLVTPPRPDMLIEPAQAPAAMTGRLSTRRGVVWLRQPAAGVSLYMELVDPALGDGVDTTTMLALTPHVWLTLLEAAELCAQASATLAAENRLLPALTDFHALAFATARLNRSLALIDEANLERERTAGRRSDEEDARRRLFNLYGLLQEQPGAAESAALFEALKLIGRHEGIEFARPAQMPKDDPDVALDQVLQASATRRRQVRLRPEDKWWTSDSGALLAFRDDNGEPVALLPGGPGGYREVEPRSGRKARVTAARAAALRPQAWQFYPALPAGRVGIRDLLQVAGKGLPADLILCTLAGLAAGLIMLLPAVLVGVIADRVIPDGEHSVLYLSTAVVAVLALLAALLYVLRGSALMRLEGRATSRLEAAFWDRLLRLPPHFLERYNAGDTALRSMAFQRLRDGLQEALASAMLSVIFLSPALLLISLYDAGLGAVCAALALLSLLLTVALGLSQIRPRSSALRVANHLSGRLNQLINGIVKLRVAGAEGSAFGVWAQHYRDQKRAELHHGAREAHLQAFSAALPFLAAATLLLAVTLPGRAAVPVGEFLAVFMLFMLFQSAVARLGASFSTLATVITALDQVQPFLDQPLELSVGGEPVGELRGAIRVDHVSFRYGSDSPLVLDDVSIDARPGEFIAITGESGCGKSTLLKLLTGLEQPDAGSIYYDGRDLRRLNVKQVRRQLGVVPQKIQLHPLDLWDNIVGSHEQTSDEEAWHAARLACLETDIKSMPMKMLTTVGHNLISGGEAQRVSIAHTLLRNPRILLLDEATNLLDNARQTTIMENIESLNTTRIVIAHRISTLRQADRIYVLKGARVIQTGTFEELSATPGAFRDLIQRQLA